MTKRYLATTACALVFLGEAGPAAFPAEQQPTAEVTVSPAVLDRARESPRAFPTVLERVKGRPAILLFIRGLDCSHCVDQVRSFARTAADKGILGIVISRDPLPAAADQLQFGFPVVADSEQDVLRHLNLAAIERSHYVVILGKTGKVVWSHAGDAPLMDTALVFNKLAELAPRVEIQVRNTSDQEKDDDFIGWSPVACRIRVVPGSAGPGQLRVVLTNDPPRPPSLPCDRPPDGDVRFARAVLPGQTANDDTLELHLPPDSQWVTFFIAGKFPRASSNKKDAVIEVHEGSETGPLLGTHAVMVRVRKDYRCLTAAERTEFLSAVAALRDMGDLARDRFEPFVRMHMLAAMGRREGFDQAHISSGFLPWHRAYLLLFERELQKTHPHVALPYWLMDQRPAHFAPEALGTNWNAETGGFQTEVVLAPSNPLYGWRVRFDGLGVLVRRPADHTEISVNAGYDSDRVLWDRAGDDYHRHRRVLEEDPHNIGHTNTGEWMEQCVSSPADPLFWIFHCHHDHLWARWQWNYDRFETSGRDPKHYSPERAFKPGDPNNRRFPYGHHLPDPMWPWDGTRGQVFQNDRHSTRPAENPFGRFPAASIAGLWPDADASPAPADMIDYLGLTASRLQHGVAYDDTPFGTNAQLIRPLMVADAVKEASDFALDVLLDSQASESTRVRAARRIDTVTAQASERRIQDVVRDATAPVAVRQGSLRLLAESSPDAAAGEAIRVLDDKRAEGSLSREAVAVLGRLMHFSSVSDEARGAIHGALLKAAKTDARGAIRGGAIRSLATMREPAVGPLLAAMAKDPQTSPFPLDEILSLLRGYAEHSQVGRTFLDSPNDHVVLSALQLLVGDLDSKDARLGLVRDRSRNSLVRKGAMRSTMHDSPEAVAALLEVLRDSREPLDLRTEAAAALRVALRTHRKAVPEAKARDVRDAIRAVRADPGTEFGKVVQMAAAAAEQLLAKN